MGFIRYLSLNKKYSGKRANQRIFGFHRELFYFSSAANVFFSQGFRLNPLQMDIITEAGTFFDNHPRRRNKALLLDITFALAPSPVCRMQHAIQENTSPTQSSGRKGSTGAHSLLTTTSSLSPCRRVVRLAQPCMSSSRSSPSDG